MWACFAEQEAAVNFEEVCAVSQVSYCVVGDFAVGTFFRTGTWREKSDFIAKKVWERA